MKDIWLIYKKEIFIYLKDRKTVFIQFFVPLLLYPILFGGMAKMTTTYQKQMDSVPSVVYLEDAANFLAPVLFENSQIFVPASSKPNSPAEDLRTDRVNLILSVDAPRLQESPSQQTTLIRVTFDPAREASEKAFRRLEKFIEMNDASIMRARLKIENLTSPFLVPSELIITKTTGPSEQIGKFLGIFLPYLLLISLFAGAMQFGADITAGEKERGTLLALLATRISRIDIMQGKLFAIFSVAIVAIAFNLLGMYLGAIATSSLVTADLPKAAATNAPSFNLLTIINPATVALTLGLMIPLGLFFSAIILWVGAQAKSVKEAITTMVPGIFVLVVLGVFSMSPLTEKLNWLPFVPIMNITVAIRKIFTNQFVIWEYAAALGMTIGLAMLMVYLAARLLDKESTLFKS